jgi:N-acylneuraminate cytidylyltransferase
MERVDNLTRRIALIPARGGSERIPRKNIRPFLGEPILARVVGTALESGQFDEVIVTTDDQEIAVVARSAGASVPFMRGAEFADNHTGIAVVIADALEKIGLNDDSTPICVLFSTAALLASGDVSKAVATFDQLEHIEHLMGVCRHPAPIERAWRRTGDGTAEMVDPTHRLTRSQDLEPAYYDAGQIYVSRPSAWQRLARGTQPRTHLHELPAWRVADIDDESDWERAEQMARALDAERT